MWPLLCVRSYNSSSFVYCVCETLLNLRNNLPPQSRMVHPCCRLEIKTWPVIHRSRFVHHMQVLSPDFSRYLSHSIKISSHAQDQEHQHGTCAAGLPGFCDKNLVTHTMNDHKSPSAWLRGLSQPEKPTQGASARAQCPTRGRNPLTAARTARKTHRFLNGGRVP